MKKDITSKEAIIAITEDIAFHLLNLTITDVEFMDKGLKRVEKREADIVAKDELEVLLHITSRLAQLTEDDEYKLGKYMLMLETLSDNRDLQSKLKEAEEMLRDIRYEKLPSYEIGMERGMERGFSNGISEGLSQGLSRGILKTAITMISKFKLSVEDVASELNISIDELKKHLK